jgi:NhaA family Na+:H+ antiporter
MNNENNTFISNFLKLESSGGILLFATTILALIFANTPLERFYDLFLSTPVEIRVANLEIAKPLLLFINDVLMAVLFFLVGLELKREFIVGEL